MLSNFRSASFAPEGKTEKSASGVDDRETKIIKLESVVRHSLNRVMTLLYPAIATADHDEAMIELALSKTDFVDPLSKHEVVVLACGLYNEHLGISFDYNDVLELTTRFRGKAMNTTTVYNTLKNLSSRGLIEEKGREFDAKTERLSKVFTITSVGREAFRLAIMNAHFLTNSTAPVAA